VPTIKKENTVNFYLSFGFTSVGDVSAPDVQCILRNSVLSKFHEPCTARAGEAHTIGETLIKPCAVEMAECMLTEHAKKKLQISQLSSNTVHCRIQNLSNNIKGEMVL
jgi:hypothetical protein